MKLALALGARRIEAIRYRWTEPAPARMRAVYHPALNEFDGLRSLQLTGEHWEPA